LTLECADSVFELNPITSFIAWLRYFKQSL
jgi:hypothetical protein